MLTKTQFKILLILLDNEGHAGWELAKALERKESNLNPILKDLENSGIIFQGETRKSMKDHKYKGDYKEFPYFLNTSLENLRKLIKEIIESKEIYETYFVFRIIMISKYIAAMKEKFKDDINMLIINELSNSYTPYKDLFVLNIIKPRFLEDDLVGQRHLMTSEVDFELIYFRELEQKLLIEERPLEIPSGLEIWYNEYQSMRRDQEIGSFGN